MVDRRMYPTASVPLDGGDRRGGTVTLSGSNPTTVDTGLSSIDHAVAIVDGASAPGLDPQMITLAFDGGTLSIYAWKATSATDPTLIASTDSSRQVHWFAVGL